MTKEQKVQAASDGSIKEAVYDNSKRAKRYLISIYSYFALSLFAIVLGGILGGVTSALFEDFYSAFGLILIYVLLVAFVLITVGIVMAVFKFMWIHRMHQNAEVIKNGTFFLSPMWHILLPFTPVGVSMVLGAFTLIPYVGIVFEILTQLYAIAIGITVIILQFRIYSQTASDTAKKLQIAKMVMYGIITAMSLVFVFVGTALETVGSNADVIDSVDFASLSGLFILLILAAVLSVIVSLVDIILEILIVRRVTKDQLEIARQKKIKVITE